MTPKSRRNDVPSAAKIEAYIELLRHEFWAPRHMLQALQRIASTARLAARGDAAPSVTDARDAIRNQIIASIRRIHHYGDPPDARLADDVTGDLADILDLVDRFAVTLAKEWVAAARRDSPTLENAEDAAEFERFREFRRAGAGMTRAEVKGRVSGAASDDAELTGETRAYYGDIREPINVHPEVIKRLRRILFCPEMRGVGYSEFIDRALDLAERQLRASAAPRAQSPQSVNVHSGNSRNAATDVRAVIEEALRTGYVGESETPLDGYGKEVLREVLAASRTTPTGHEASPAALWAIGVANAWNEHWRDKQGHRYQQDYAAFLGERFLTDFNLRWTEPSASHRVSPTPTGLSPSVAPTLEAEKAKYARLGAYAMMDLLSGLYPGFDRQALDSVFRAMQDKYGSSVNQVERAASLALSEESTVSAGLHTSGSAQK